MTLVLRCPGAHADDGETRHNSWTLRPDNPPQRRYYCIRCETYYPYLVNVAATPLMRYVTTGSLGPVMPSDTTDYGN